MVLRGVWRCSNADRSQRRNEACCREAALCRLPCSMLQRCGSCTARARGFVQRGRSLLTALFQAAEALSVNRPSTWPPDMWHRHRAADDRRRPAIPPAAAADQGEEARQPTIRRWCLLPMLPASSQDACTPHTDKKARTG
eukprot:352178-Chlamydomonas_euryale.AAC.12